jgi:nucleoside-diphosphate-sugar epimerase
MPGRTTAHTPKRVVVTGATGGLGRNAVEYLRGLGVQVRATGRDAPVGRRLEQLGAEFVPLDLARAAPEAVAQLLHGADTLWHCAALSSAWGNASAFAAANVRATEVLACAAVAQGVARVVHISSPSVYFRFCHAHALTESAVHAPGPFATHYARSKAESEQVLWAAIESVQDGATHAVCLRPRGIFGPHDRLLMPRIRALILAHNGVLPLPRGGEAVLDVTYVTNVVRAMWRASVAADLPPRATYNISNGEPARLAAVLRELFVSRLRLPLRIRALPYRVLDAAAVAMEAVATLTGREPAMTRYSVGALNFDMTLDLTRSRAELGYEPSVGLDEGISRTATWLIRHA